VEENNEDIPQLSVEESNILTANFDIEEVKEAVMQMERNKAPGPDGFQVEFYQKNWDVIKLDLTAMFTQLQTGELPLFRLNYSVITLLSKKEDATRIEQYRPICPLNVSFIFTKVGTNRVTRIAHMVAKPT
jgi:mannosylglycoprotein endo-beta-mannosidase